MRSRVLGHAKAHKVSKVAIILTAILLAFLVGTTSACDRWVTVTVLNKSGVPVDVNINNVAGLILRPQGKYRGWVPHQVFPGYWPGGPTVPPPNYPIKAYEFVPGNGNIAGWRDENGGWVVGGDGELIFCVTYTWEELKAMNFTITITRNVFPGYQPPDCSP